MFFSHDSSTNWILIGPIAVKITQVEINNAQPILKFVNLKWPRYEDGFDDADSESGVLFWKLISPTNKVTQRKKVSSKFPEPSASSFSFYSIKADDLQQGSVATTYDFVFAA